MENTKHILKTNHLYGGYDGKQVLKDINITIPDGKISVILGANACGKSTLLKTMTRILQPAKGSVTLDGTDIRKFPSKKLACQLGLLPQTPVVPEGVTVSDLVFRGRYPHKKMFEGTTKKDLEAVTEAMEIMNIVDLADRSISELSGGQRQRAWIATALAQDTDILFLDEPTTYLDVNYQVEILDLMADLNERKHTTIVMVLHDINLSVRYADYLFAMKEGKIIKEGTPEDVISEALIEEVFGLKSKVIKDPVSSAPYAIPVGRHFSSPDVQ